MKRRELKEVPRVSIITVSYNSAATIADTIDSVGYQTYPDVEYIVVDGGSTDGTVEILKGNENVIDDWVSEPDDGIYDAMNRGIQRSSGEIIGILNSDDWYEPEAVETAVQTFEGKKDIDLVHGAMNVWTEDGHLHGRYGSRKSISPEFVAPFNHPTCFVRRSVYRDLGVFNREFPTAADYDFMLRFKRADYKDMYIDSVLVNFRHGGVSTRHRFVRFGELWKVLRRNEYGWWSSCKALLFRSVRDSAVYIIELLSLHGLRGHIRRYAPYRSRCTGEDEH